MKKIDKIKTITFVSDNTYMGFKSILPEKFLVVPASMGKYNLFWSCGLPIGLWLSRVSHLLAFCLHYGVGSMSLTREVLGRMFREQSDEMIPPTLTEFNEEVKRSAKGYRRLQDMVDGVKNKTGGMSIDTGDFFSPRKGVDLQKLATNNQHLIFEIPRFITEYRHVFIGYVMLWFYTYLQTTKLNTMYVMIMDEAYSLINQASISSQYSVGSPFLEMVMEGRKLGLGQIYVSQELKTVQSSIQSNTNIKLFHKPVSGTDAEEIKKYIVGNDEQKQALMALDKGKLVMQSAKERHAILVNVPEYHG